MLLRSRWPLLACMVAANLPDVDFIPGLLIGEFNAFHHGPSHSLLWAIGVGVGCWLIAEAMGSGKSRFKGWLAFALVTSHLAADYLCEDRSAPFGIMVFWPMSDQFFLFSHPIFHAMSKSTLVEVFTSENVGPALREAWIGGLLIVSVLCWKLLPFRLRRTTSIP